MKKVSRTFYVDDELWQELRLRAVRDGTSASALTSEYIEAGLHGTLLEELAIALAHTVDEGDEDAELQVVELITKWVKEHS